MKLFTLLFSTLLGCGVVFGQQISATSAKTKLRPGESVQVTIALSAAVSISAFEYEESGSTRFTISNRAIGQQAQSAQKALYCEGVRCLLVGLNANVIADGPVVTATLTAGAQPGQVTLGLANIIAAKPDGTTGQLMAGPDLVLSILKAQDLNGDGKVDAMDLQIGVDQVFGRSPCGSADQNADGACDVRDLQIVANEAVRESQ